ncbi:MAG: CDP-alcohol phosphatidyltransferase family protein [Armatimonadota bacterium]
MMAEDRTVMQSFATPANLLTFSRLILLPVVIYGLVTELHWLTVGAMVLGWLTDLVDGRVARMMNQGGSKFGKALDSTIDFTLIYGLFIAFYAAGRLATYQFAFLYLAMLSILTLQMFLGGTGHGEEVATTTFGKPTGALQYAYLLLLVALEVPAVGESPVMQTVHMVYFWIVAASITLNTIEIALLLRRMGREPMPAEPAT